MRFPLKIVFLSALFFLFSLISFAQPAKAYNLSEFIAPASRPAKDLPGGKHQLTSGECVYHTTDGNCPTGLSPIRQWKNENWEQFCVGTGIDGSGVYRQEDTSGTFITCRDGTVANYTLYRNSPNEADICRQFNEGDEIAQEGVFWAPMEANPGQSWTMPPHQILNVAVNRSTGEKTYCEPRFSWCPVAWPDSGLVHYYPANSYTFSSSGLKNIAPMIEIAGTGGGEIFQYMQGYGLVGFRTTDGAWNVQLQQYDTCDYAGSNIDTERLKKPCTSTMTPEHHPLRPYPFNPCDPFIPERNVNAFKCGEGLNVRGTFELPRYRRSDVRNLPGGTIDINVESTMRDKLPADNALNPGAQRVYQCAGITDGSKICALERVPFNIEIDLKKAKLPVIGYTEGNLPDSAKVNNFLSWYLQGGDWNPTSNPSTYDIGSLITFSGPIRKLFSYQSQNDIRMVIKSSGSDIHNYLLRPYSNSGRIGNVNNEFSKLFSRVPLSSMEDIVGETVITAILNDGQRTDAQPPGVQTPSQTDLAAEINALQLRITKVNPSQPLQWVSDGRLYMPHLRETAGLSFLLQTYALPYTTNNKPISDLNPANRINPDPAAGENDPDKKNIIGTAEDKNAHQGETDTTVTQWTKENENYGHTWTRNTEIIDNPDTPINTPNNEIKAGSGNLVDLGPSLDSLGQAPAPFLEQVGNQYVTQPYPAPASFNGLCQISNAISIPGDSMVDKNGWKIRGQLTYTQAYQYDALQDPCTPAVTTGFPPCTVDGDRCDQGGVCGPDFSCVPHISLYDCVINCKQNNSGWTDSDCNAWCLNQGTTTRGTCQPKSSTWPVTTSGRVTVMTKTPLIETIYNRLVAGPQSVLKRFLPARTTELIATNNCPNGEYIKGESVRDQTGFDKSCIRSVSTYADYSATAGNPSLEHPSVPNTSGQTATPNTNAKLYFPFLGSLSDYFLGVGSETLNLQRLLRPQGFNSIGIGSNPPVTEPVTPGVLSCNFPISNCSSVDFTKPVFQTISNLYNKPGSSYWSLVNEPWAQEMINNTSCPKFTATLWLEESAGSAIGGYGLGCIYYFNTGQRALINDHIGGPSAFTSYAAFRNHYQPLLQDQINCLNTYTSAISNANLGDETFRTFMCQYSGEVDKDSSLPFRQCDSFTNNPNFPINVCSIGTQVGL